MSPIGRYGSIVRRIDDQERRARLAVRHHLAPGARASSVVDAADDIVGLHGTDPVSVYLSAWARTRNLTVATVEDALYDSRTLLKFLGMRRTMFVVPIELAGIIHAACTTAIARRERSRLHSMLETA